MKAVLTYHSIDDSGSPVSIDERSFRAHVEWLASGAVEVVPLPELTSVPESQDAVSVTFDDGLENFGRIAAPALLEARIPVTVFVVTDSVGGRSDWSGTGGSVPVFPLLDWEALGVLADEGVELGAHTRTHPVLTRLDAASIEEEVLGGAQRLREETGRTPQAFAYPYGIHDDRVVQIAARAFQVAVTARLDVVKPGGDPHRVPRLDMWYYRDPDLLRAWGSRRFALYLGARRLARGLRQALSRDHI
jgi:peptidoglycan/xylan/chitin deacetylase (PgdA/CDA1 family)